MLNKNLPIFQYKISTGGGGDDFLGGGRISFYTGRLHPYASNDNFSTNGGHGGRVVTLLPPTSEAGVRFLARPQVGKLVVACRWSAVSSALPTTRRDMTCTVLKAT